jgi:hypothetical protein
MIRTAGLALLLLGLQVVQRDGPTEDITNVPTVFPRSSNRSSRKQRR